MNIVKTWNSKGGCNVFLTWLYLGTHPVRKNLVTNLNQKTICVPISDHPLTT